MKSLAEMIKIQKFTQESDLQIIYKWFTENEQENVALELIPKLAKSQFDRVQHTLNYARSWIPCMVDMENYFDKKTARILNLVQQYCMLDMDLKESNSFDEINDIVSNLEMPQIFFQPAIKYLEKYNIRFKEKSNNE